MNYTKWTPALIFWGFLSIFVMFAYCMVQMPREFKSGIIPRLDEIQMQKEKAIEELNDKLNTHVHARHLKDKVIFE